MLDVIPDDYFTYICHLDYPYFDKYISLFSTCKRLHALSNAFVHNLLSNNYKLLIRNYNIENSKRMHNCVYDIYGDNFTMCTIKLNDLAVKSVQTNNMELLNLLYEIAPLTMSSQYLNVRMIKSALEIKSLDLINHLLGKNPPFTINVIPGEYYRSRDITQCILNDDLFIFMDFVDRKNAEDFLIRAIKASSIKIVNYIITRFKLDKHLIATILSKTIQCIDDKMMNLLVNIYNST